MKTVLRNREYDFAKSYATWLEAMSSTFCKLLLSYQAITVSRMRTGVKFVGKKIRGT